MSRTCQLRYRKKILRIKTMKFILQITPRIIIKILFRPELKSLIFILLIIYTV